MAKPHPGLLDLPPEVLGNIVTLVEDLEALPNIALTCRYLGELIYSSDQWVWQSIHRQLYDDPARAQAFPEVRTCYEWRKQVIERHLVLRFVRESETWLPGSSAIYRRKPVHRVLRAVVNAESEVARIRNGSGQRNFDEWSDRILTAMLGLYIDLPPFGQTSANEPILVSLLSTRARWSCELASLRQVRYRMPFGLRRHDCGPYTGDRQVLHYMAVVGNDAREFYPRSRKDITRLAAPGLPINDWLHTPNAQVDWAQISDDAMRTVNDRHRDRRASQIFMQGYGFPNVLRGEHRGVWDWADVRGPWTFALEGKARGGQYMERLHYTEYNHSWYFPESCAFTPAESKRAVSQIFLARSDTSAVTVDALWDCFPDPEPPHHQHYPPTYFYDDSTPDIFVYGVVCLSRDQPPELVWTIAWQSLTDTQLGAILQGVQIGGCGGNFGIVGSWGARAWGPPDMLSSHPRYRRRPEVPTVHASPDERFDRFGMFHCYKLPNIYPAPEG